MRSIGGNGNDLVVLNWQEGQPNGIRANRGNLNLNILSSDTESRLLRMALWCQEQCRAGTAHLFPYLASIAFANHSVGVAIQEIHKRWFLVRIEENNTPPLYLSAWKGR